MTGPLAAAFEQKGGGRETSRGPSVTDNGAGQVASCQGVCVCVAAPGNPERPGGAVRGWLPRSGRSPQRGWGEEAGLRGKRDRSGVRDMGPDPYHARVGLPPFSAHDSSE